MTKLSTNAFLCVAIAIATALPTASTGFAQEKANSPTTQPATASAGKPSAPELWRQVEVIRTAHGG